MSLSLGHPDPTSRRTRQTTDRFFKVADKIHPFPDLLDVCKGFDSTTEKTLFGKVLSFIPNIHRRNGAST